MTGSSLETALDLLARGFWPIPIHPRGARIGARGSRVAEGKEPIGLSWGKTRPTAASLRAAYRDHPGAGVGLKLGKDAGIIDVEVDDPATGPDSLATLFGGDLPATLGWSSARGNHHVFAWSDRVARYGKTKLEKLPGLPGLEIRFGALGPAGKQLQSVCPPTLTTEGQPREWNGIETIADLPESFFIALDPILLAEPGPAAREPIAHRNGDSRRAYAEAALEKELALLESAAEGSRNDQLNLSAFKLGTLVEAGSLEAAEVEGALTVAARRIGLAPGEIGPTIRSGLAAGRREPRDLSGIGRDPAPYAPYAPKAPPANGRPLLQGAPPFGAYGAYGAGSALDEDDVPIPARDWPKPPEEEAYAGLAGEVVRRIAPHTEADPVAILVQLLVAFGNLIGRRAFFQVESTRHYLNLYAALIGRTSKARKGTSWDHVRHILRGVDPDWEGERIQSGLSSGEGLIWAVRDPIARRDPVKQQGRVIGYEDVEADPGVGDKRLLVLETELGGTLRVLTREGNTLSALVRQAWDSGVLRSLTKTAAAKATGAHISIIGHITRDELERNLTATEAANGFANRFLWACVRRARSLPFGGQIQEVDFAPVLHELTRVVERAALDVQLRRDVEADRLWASVYDDLSEGLPGLLGSVTGRAEAQTMRLACLYALLDDTEWIGRPHLESALALWRYCERSARYVFGDAMGDPDADALLSALRAAPAGLSRSQIRSDVFGRHKSAPEVARILGRLLEHGLIRGEKIATGGRSAEVWFARDGLSSQQPEGTNGEGADA